MNERKRTIGIWIARGVQQQKSETVAVQPLWFHYCKTTVLTQHWTRFDDAKAFFTEYQSETLPTSVYDPGCLRDIYWNIVW